MHPFYLTPAALSDFSLLIFIGFVIAYLGLLLRRARQHGEKAVTMGFLLGAFAGMAGAILCIFLEETLYPHAGQPRYVAPRAPRHSMQSPPNRQQAGTVGRRSPFAAIAHQPAPGGGGRRASRRRRGRPCGIGICRTSRSTTAASG